MIASRLTFSGYTPSRSASGCWKGSAREEEEEEDDEDDDEDDCSFCFCALALTAFLPLVGEEEAAAAAGAA